jgi:calcineurin-like phosphoesterase family protein
MINFTSESHFGDRRDLRVDRRALPDTTAHVLALVENWNGTVPSVTTIND